MFTPNEEKEIILKWFYGLYKMLGGMTTDEVYVYLLGCNKDDFIADIDSMLTELNEDAAKDEENLITYQVNIKDLQKKLKKL